jgi:ATP-binding cassette subfamily C protein LapB
MSLTVVTTILMTVVGALAIFDHQMTIGSLIAANMLSARVVSPLNKLVGAWHGFAAYRAAANRLEEAFGLREERIKRTMELDRPRGDLTLEQVGFLFDPAGQPVLENIEFSMRPGVIHGIVGRNGGGKSTLLKLMGGLYQPASGRILLDDESGVARRPRLLDWLYAAGWLPVRRIDPRKHPEWRAWVRRCCVVRHQKFDRRP